jgi:hypothetical protein
MIFSENYQKIPYKKFQEKNLSIKERFFGFASS